MLEQLEVMSKKAGNNFSALRELATENLPEAIRRLPEFIATARDVGNRAYESMAGGPNQDWIVPLFDIIGESYADLDVESRTAFLRHLMNYFNSLRYDYSQNHVELINSGALVADIVATNGLYWPGLDRPRHKLAGKDPDALKRMPHEELDSFWIALALIYNGESSTLPIRQWYYKAFPDAVTSAISYLAAAFGITAEERTKEKGTRFEDELNASLNRRLDPALHDRVRARVAERAWLILPK